jgi:hypothetical protein
MSYTSINGVSNPCLSFIGNCDNSLAPVMNWDVQQKLRHITGSKNLVDGCKSRRALLRAKVRRKDAI